jgi:hypothetical protein
MPMMNNTSVGEGLVVLAMMSVIRILRLVTAPEKGFSGNCLKNIHLFLKENI